MSGLGLSSVAFSPGLNLSPVAVCPHLKLSPHLCPQYQLVDPDTQCTVELLDLC